MKKIKFNKNSWHYKLYKMWESPLDIEQMEYEADFCSYFSYVIFKMIILLIVFLLVAGGTFFIFTSFYGSYQYFINNNDKYLAATASALLLLTALAIISIVSLVVYISKKIKHIGIKNNSFIATSYSKFKDKVCYKIEFEE